VRTTVSLAFVLVTGCTPGLPEARVSDPQAQAELQARAEHVEKLEAKLEESDPKIREACEFKAGDCLMELRDKRRELVRGRTFLECEAYGNATQKARCEEQNLLDRGETEALDRYYDYQTWCLSGMEKCIVELVEQAKSDAHGAMVQKRRDEFFSAELARGLELDLRIAEEQLAYARITLPPVADDACLDLASVKRCRKNSADQVTELEQHLALPQAEYEPERAEALLRRAKATDIECVDLEKQCVAEELTKYGATKATEALMQENFKLVAERQRLQEQLDPATAQACMGEGQTKYAPYIVENYRQYAKQRVEYFRIQMHRAFANVHRAQIACLKRAGAK